MLRYLYRPATSADLECLWNKNIATNPDEPAWVRWKREYIGYNADRRARTYAVLCDGEPVGEGTLLFAPTCNAIRGRTLLADGMTTANINALRIEKPHEGQGHISRLVRLMEQEAAAMGYTRVTIGVEARETRNLGIYLHWGYTEFILSEVEDGALVLYYGKHLSSSDS